MNLNTKLQLDNISLGDSVSNQDLPIEKIIPNDFEDFKETVESYISLEDEIEELQKKISAKRKVSKEYYKELEDYMKQHNIPILNNDKGNIKLEVKYEKERLNNKIMKSKLAEFFKSNEKALECYKYLDQRDKIEKIRLKIVKN